MVTQYYNCYVGFDNIQLAEVYGWNFEYRNLNIKYQILNIKI